jgi:hypothetical protein
MKSRNVVLIVRVSRIVPNLSMEWLMLLYRGSSFVAISYWLLLRFSPLAWLMSRVQREDDARLEIKEDNDDEEVQ